MTANQLVAYNLRRARELRGLTQEQAAEKLEPYLGRKWSKAVFSAAETSVKSERVREFSADELLAFASAFDLPIAWFFVPPNEPDMREPITMGGPKNADTTSLLDAVAPPQIDEIRARLSELARTLPKRDLSKREQELAEFYTARVAGSIARSFGHIAREAEHLRIVAGILETASRRALDEARGGAAWDPLVIARENALKKDALKKRAVDQGRERKE
jgi:hypothetical protein